MREILFRGQRIDNGEWVEGYYAHFENFAIKDVIYSDGNLYKQVNPDTVGQKWEKSLKTFWGGDLFTALCSPHDTAPKIKRLCKVVENPDGMSAVIWYKGEWWAYHKMDWTSAEIIGNIYDNPELI